MPRPRPLVLFVLGSVLGALSWFVLSPILHRPTTRSAPGPDRAEAQVISNRPGNESPDSITSDSRAAAAIVAERPGLHLWEALALRGAPTDNEANWFKLPDMTGKNGYDAASPDAELNPAFVAFFDLTPTESKRVQTLLQSTLRLQNQMDLAHLEPIESKFRIKIAFGIPDYSAESAAVRQGFDGGLREILGDARHRVYQDWGAKTFRDDYPGLAGVRREYHIIPAGADDPPGSLQIVTVKLAPGEEWKGMHFTSYHQNFEDALERTQLPLSRFFTPPATPTTPAAATTP